MTSFATRLEEAVPSLRRFALSLTQMEADADDLVQDCLERALTHREKFEPGTNLDAWLFTIMRNRFVSDRRKRREVTTPVDAMQDRLVVGPAQQERLNVEDFLKSFRRLPDRDQAVLAMIGGAGLSYEETAARLEVELGTVKSRLSRARARLQELYQDATSIPPLEPGDDEAVH
ncbi:MAG: sigma-70 family RNA polymerase sigma factor [Geminicoccaceae bacterium]|nr:MAG: sigma-70 family RNA polymerase sigma factor [Geminicoccaceae bacterium]